MDASLHTPGCDDGNLIDLIIQGIQGCLQPNLVWFAQAKVDDARTII
jgi:hypothetical protein